MKSKKKHLNNIWKIIWIIGIYATLLLIFGLVINYKVEWETKDLNRYLYFYNCSKTVCTSDIEQKDYYGKIKCEKNICPYIVEQNKNTLIINKNNKKILYDYLQNKIINDKYEDYYFINDELIAVKNDQNKYGIINITGSILSDLNHNKIIDYKNGYLIYEDKGKYGLTNIITSQELVKEYDEITFVDEKHVIVKQNQKYMIYNYNEKKDYNQKYNYLYSVNGYILTFNNKKIDILDKNNKSVLIIKINSHYDYTTKQEQGSLKFRIEDNNLLFNVVNSDNKYVIHSFNLSTGKLNN